MQYDELIQRMSVAGLMAIAIMAAAAAAALSARLLDIDPWHINLS